MRAIRHGSGIHGSYHSANARGIPLFSEAVDAGCVGCLAGCGIHSVLPYTNCHLGGNAVNGKERQVLVMIPIVVYLSNILSYTPSLKAAFLVKLTLLYLRGQTQAMSGKSYVHPYSVTTVGQCIQLLHAVWHGGSVGGTARLLTKT